MKQILKIIDKISLRPPPIFSPSFLKTPSGPHKTHYSRENGNDEVHKIPPFQEGTLYPKVTSTSFPRMRESTPHNRYNEASLDPCLPGGDKVHKQGMWIPVFTGLVALLFLFPFESFSNLCTNNSECTKGGQSCRTRGVCQPAGSADKRCFCTQDSHILNGNSCVPRCVGGASFNSSNCSCTCPSGQQTSGGQSSYSVTNQSGNARQSLCQVRCPSWQRRDNGRCVNRCSDSQEWRNGQCEDRCPAGSHWDGQMDCITCSAPKTRWNSSTRRCECPADWPDDRGGNKCWAEGSFTRLLNGEARSTFFISSDGDKQCRNPEKTYTQPGTCQGSNENCWCKDSKGQSSTIETSPDWSAGCVPRCPKGTYHNASCECRCPNGKTWGVHNRRESDGGRETWEGKSCCPYPAGSPKTRWDGSRCTCPTGQRENGNLCCTPCSNGYASTSSCACRQNTVITPLCPRSGEPHKTRRDGSSCRCPTNKHPVGMNPTLCCTRSTCPEGKTREEGSCTCSPTTCISGLILCGGVCIEGKSCPGVTEKVCPTEDCPAPRDPQGLELATPATCENEDG